MRAWRLRYVPAAVGTDHGTFSIADRCGCSKRHVEILAGVNTAAEMTDVKVEAQAFLDAYTQTYMTLQYESAEAEWAAGQSHIDS